MIETFQKNNYTQNNELNDSNFEKEGEYIIQKKPKYKYEIKIIHINPKDTDLNRPKTPEKIISPKKFSIINDSSVKYYNEKDKLFLSKNKVYELKTPNRKSTVRFYSNNLSSEKLSQISNYKMNNNYGNYNYYCNCNYNNNISPYNNNKCICKEEFNKIIKECYGNNSNDENIQYHNHFSNYNNVNEERNEYNNIYQRKKIYITNNDKLNNKNYYISPSKNKHIYMNKSQDYYNINENNNYENNNYYNNKEKIILFNNNNNNFNNNLYKGSSPFKKRRKIKRYKNKKLKISSEINNDNTNNNLLSNYSFLSIDTSKNKNNSLYKSVIIDKKRDNKIKNYSIYRLQKNNNIKDISNIMSTPRSNSKKSNNSIMINKSSETKQKIKIVPKGQKINPLIIKKKVEKPKIEKIINRDGSISDIIKQDSVITSIESTSVINSKNENVVKEYVTKVYTTLTKNLDGTGNNNYIENINDNSINKDKNEKLEKINISKDNENNSILIRRDFKDKNENDCNLEIIDNSNNTNDNKIEKRYILNKDNKQFKKKHYIVNNNIYNDNIINENSSIHKNSDYSSIGYNSLNFFENKQIVKNEQINHIKYLYNNNNLKGLKKYFLKLKEEDKLNILKILNDGNIENKKIYAQLIDILKDKENNEEDNDNIINNNYFENNNEIIYDNEKINA